MKTTTFFMALCFALTVSAGDSPKPTPAKRAEFDVRAFGAKGDGKTLDTAAIQKALDACGQAGGGTVHLPAGTYLSKPFTLRTKTTLFLDAGVLLKATDERADFEQAEKRDSFNPFIGGKELEDVTIAGPGIIDGSGAKWWAPAEEARRKVSGYTLPRPNLIVLTRVKNLVIRDVTIQNSPKFHVVPTDCEDVVITNVTILAPAGAANTDAIDPSASRRVLITKCLVDVGDDNVAIKAGKKMAGREFACEDITVTDCVFKHGHGMSIGSETVGGVRNVTVRNVTFEGTENGIRIKSPRGRGGTIENLTYENITMKSVERALTITCYYPKIPKTDTAQPMTPETPIFRQIHIRNLNATCYANAGIVVGLPESYVSDVVLENVKISAATTGLEFRYAKGVQCRNVEVTAKKGQPFLLDDAQVEGLSNAQK